MRPPNNLALTLKGIMTMENDNESKSFLDSSWDDVAGTHPKGQFQFVLKEITPMVAEYIEKDKAGQPRKRVEHVVFSLITKGDDGELRVIDSKKMTLKVNSTKSDLFTFVSGWYGGIKVEDFKTKVPRIGMLLNRNGMVSINHETSQRGTSYASIGGVQQIIVQGGKPTIPDLVIPEDFFYEPYHSRKNLEPNTGGNPKYPWFQPAFTEDEEAGEFDPAKLEGQKQGKDPLANATANRSGGGTRPSLNRGNKASDTKF